MNEFNCKRMENLSGNDCREDESAFSRLIIGGLIMFLKICNSKFYKFFFVFFLVLFLVML